MHEYAIIVAYHRDNCPVTLAHFQQLQGLHPGVPVVPVSSSESSFLPGTVNVSEVPSRWSLSDPWRSADAVYYRWFEDRNLTARRYVLLEWDVYCDGRLPEILSPVWDSPFAAMDYIRPGCDWPWFGEIPSLPDAMRPYAAGVSPFVFLASHSALSEVVRHAPTEPVYCELRLGTTLTARGIPVDTMPWLHGTCSWRPELIRRVARPTLYHPVKTLDQLGF
ncbi:MAG TPA: hypothetical protein VKA15_01100 [Isosphaeraceae bacterium]|nr:hypothetical protein [Isosphaeraceae bacterium]